VAHSDATASRLEVLMSQSDSDAPRDAILRAVARLYHTAIIDQYGSLEFMPCTVGLYRTLFRCRLP
jgi:hypothetical protein